MVFKNAFQIIAILNEFSNISWCVILNNIKDLPFTRICLWRRKQLGIAIYFQKGYYFGEDYV